MPSKRPLPEDFKTDDTSCSTDALCRAVKRLNTDSAHTSSCTSISKDVASWELDEEASSRFLAAGGSQLVYPELHRLGISEELEDELSRATAQVAHQSQPRSHLGAQLRTPDEARGGQDAQGHSQSSQGNPPSGGPSIHRMPSGNPAASGRIVMDNSKVELLASGASLRASLSSRPKSAGGQSSISLSSLPGDSADSVPQPRTPGREETVSPKKGYRLGTREEAPSVEAYDEVYEQANNLLKNLHFEWLHRKGRA